jgi:hypothetical protein
MDSVNEQICFSYSEFLFSNAAPSSGFDNNAETEKERLKRKGPGILALVFFRCTY